MATGKAAEMSAVETLLIEILTEELPPSILHDASQTFARVLGDDLELNNFREQGSEVHAFATPRRLAALITRVSKMAADRPIEFIGPSVKFGLDADGKPTPALIGFARKQGVDISILQRQETPKGEVFVYRTLAKGGLLDTNLDLKVQHALDEIRATKVMRWGSSDTKFMRPVHGLVMLHGSRVIPGEIMGLKSSNRTFGHRQLSTGPILIRRAADYEKILRQRGRVIVSFEERRAHIEADLISAAKAKRAYALWRHLVPKLQHLDVSSGLDWKIQVAKVILRKNEELLDEVTALVEWPKIYVGQFESEFVTLPPECISVTMQKNQKYFVLVDGNANLETNYLIVANTEVANPTSILEGNSKVLRARLSDARFFFEQDTKTPLAERVPRLANVVYHNKLGTQLERVQRIKSLSVEIVQHVKDSLDASVNTENGPSNYPLWSHPDLKKHVERAADLCKADLLTEMVGEFPELQGFIGAHYAENDGEHREVTAAIEGHYRPRFAGDNVEYLTPVGICVALADKLDMLAGLFGVGQVPTGDKDPFGLRRAALGVVRILIECDVPIPLDKSVNWAFSNFGGRVADAHTDLETFVYDRLSGYLKDQGYSTLEVDSVVSLRPSRVNLVLRQLKAVRAFNKLPEAQGLAAANKRVVNILKQASAKGESFANAEFNKMKEPAERTLLEALQTASSQAAPLLKQGNFAGYLKTFAVLKSPVDAFFDSVMVMVDEPETRHNRLALLADLRREMNRVADLSRLAT